MSDRTIRLHRVLAAKVERVQRAFLDPLALAKWLPPQGFVAQVHSMEAKVGGGYRMSFVNFNTGEKHTFGGKFHEISPTKIRYTDKFDDLAMPGEMEVTVVLRAVMVGTELTITQNNVPEQIPLEGCYLGWQESLEQLADIVEPEIP